MNCCQAAGEQGIGRTNPSAPTLEGKFFHSQKRSFPFHDVRVPFLQRPNANENRQSKLAVFLVVGHGIAPRPGNHCAGAPVADRK